MANKKPNIFIATPRTKPYLDGYVRSLFQTRFKYGARMWMPLPNMAIDIARNWLVAEARRQNMDAILWADCDATWNMEALERLWEWDLPIVSGIMYRRELPPTPTIGKYMGMDPEKGHLYSFADTINKCVEVARNEGVKEGDEIRNDILFTKNDDYLVEVDGIGHHFALVRMEVYDKMTEPYYKLTSMGAGEDFYFCRNAKDLGFPIYADFAVHTGHEVGTGVDFGLNELLMFAKDTSFADDTQILEVGTWD